MSHDCCGCWIEWFQNVAPSLSPTRRRHMAARIACWLFSTTITCCVRFSLSLSFDVRKSRFCCCSIEISPLSQAYEHFHSVVVQWIGFFIVVYVSHQTLSPSLMSTIRADLNRVRLLPSQDSWFSLLWAEVLIGTQFKKKCVTNCYWVTYFLIEYEITLRSF